MQRTAVYLVSEEAVSHIQVVQPGAVPLSILLQPIVGGCDGFCTSIRPCLSLGQHSHRHNLCGWHSPAAYARLQAKVSHAVQLFLRTAHWPNALEQYKCSLLRLAQMILDILAMGGS